MLIVSSAETWWGGASSSREPSSIPAGYASHTGYQYDSISRVAGQREPAPPSKFSNDGGFRNRVFSGMRLVSATLTPSRKIPARQTTGISLAWEPGPQACHNRSRLLDLETRLKVFRLNGIVDALKGEISP